MAIGGMGGPRARGRYKPLAEINVTPLVDVMLVLLIIFMVTAPLMTSGVTVDLPKTAAKPVNADSTPITLSINAEGKVFVQNDQVQIGELVGSAMGRPIAASSCAATRRCPTARSCR
jgi:biopolymer transport protein TolR